MNDSLGSLFLHSGHGEETPTAITAPEDHTTFRLAQLIILLAEVAPADVKGLDLERIGYYDFFAANPFAMIEEANVRDRARLHRASFDESQLSYASTGSRFANRRQRLQHDLSLLVAYDLVVPRGGGFGSTERGAEIADRFSALYADQYRESVRVVHQHLKRLSEPQLAASARRWLRTPSLVLDLYGVSAGDPDGSDAVTGLQNNQGDPNGR
ncbi:hypothetical protein LJR044_002307 [Microbacterium foliorum]|uniref:Uncharacterized protein n=1 Tax=Microbacterium esteraromaticum TaxID=57043 RepID=A0A1R4KC07_9MICO|nr:hypothetical protein [Microbacterium esteraromaticum]SJN41827.1 hypothetical protein FM104_11660 [Microbacterium esteraromaticum]